jgi:hypothetical protein
MWADNIADRNSPQSAQVGKLANQFIVTGYLRVYGFSVFSSNAGSQYIVMFDASSLPADTAVPLMAFPISSSSNLGLYFGPMGRIFQRGLILCASSTSTTKTLNATADCFFDVEYDWLPVPGDTLES